MKKNSETIKGRSGDILGVYER